MEIAMQASVDAKLALAQIALHEAMCATRYIGLDSRIIELSSSVKSIFSSGWKAAGAAITVLTGAVGGLVFYLITHH